MSTSKDIISEIEELLEEKQFGESSEVLDSDEIFLKNDNEVMNTDLGNDGFENDTNLMDDYIENDNDVDINIDHDSEALEAIVENDTEIETHIENDSEEVVSPPKKSKKEETGRYRPLNLPLARIKQIIKMDPDVNLAGSDAVFLIAKATELFIELLSKDAYAITASSKKKTIQRKDVDAAILNTDALVFLDGAMDF